MTQLYRSMKEGSDGLPAVGPTSRTLGVRPGIDVSAIKDADPVPPGQGGMSVNPDDPLNLPVIRRPPTFGGVGKDPVWMIDTADLPAELYFRPDPASPKHGFLEPCRAMTLGEYTRMLMSTRGSWRKVGTASASGGAP